MFNQFRWPTKYNWMKLHFIFYVYRILKITFVCKENWHLGTIRRFLLLFGWCLVINSDYFPNSSVVTNLKWVEQIRNIKRTCTDFLIINHWQTCDWIQKYFEKNYHPKCHCTASHFEATSYKLQIILKL